MARYRILPVVLCAVLTAACSSALPYARIDRALLNGDPADAVDAVDKAKDRYGTQSTVLYLMDKGMVQHLAGRYTDSNDSLSRAEALSEDFYTLRIRSEIESFFTSDNALPYEGEEFEKVMLNVLMAMNYVHLGQWDEALVEARKVDHKLTVLADRNQKRMTYSRDALARYLSGVLYEATGDLSNAFVAYRLAYEAFGEYQKTYGTPIPDLLRQDLLRVSQALGLTQEYEEYRQAFPEIAWQPESSAGELVFLTYAGHAPIKRDMMVDLPFSPEALGMVLATKRRERYYGGEQRAAESILYGLSGRVVRVAVPRFVPRPSGVLYTEAIVTGAQARYSSRSAVMEDITAIAGKDLQDRLVRTTAKSAARAAWKFALAEAVRVGVRGAVKDKETGAVAGALAGAVAHMFAISTEEADKRSWATLPDRIHIGRLRVPPGTYDVELRHVGSSGAVLTSQIIRGVVVPEQGKRFVSARVLQ